VNSPSSNYLIESEASDRPQESNYLIEPETSAEPQGDYLIEPEPQGLVSKAKDTAISFSSGANSLLQMAGDFYGLVTGDMGNVVSQQARENIKYLQQRKSPQLRQAEEARRKAIDAEGDELDKALTYARETFTNPSLLSGALAEQLPNLVGIGGAGALAKAGAEKVLLKAAADQAAKRLAAKRAGQIGVGTAVATGAGMQGTDVGADLYDEAVSSLDKITDEQARSIPEIARLMDEKGASLDEAKTAFALALGREAFALGATISAGAQMLPGGRTVERAFVGRGVGRPLAGAIRGGLGEAASEAVEEGGSRVAANLLARQFEPDRPLAKGVGEAVGQAAVVGGIPGAAFGAASSRPTTQPAPESDTTAGKTGEAPASAATKSALAGAPEVALESSEGLTPEQFYAAVNIRQARLMGGEPNPEDIRIAGEVPLPKVQIDPEKANRAIEEAQSALQEWVSSTPNAPQTVEVIFDPELLHNGYGVQGYYKDDGTIAINAAFVSPDRVASIASHEWAHQTLATPEGQQAFADFVQREIPQAELDALAARYKTQDRRVLLEEWIAQNQEKAPGVIERIVARIREWLAGVGIVDLSDAEVADIMLRTLRQRGENRVQPDTSMGDGGVVPVDPNAEAYNSFIGQRTKPKMSLQKLPTTGDVVDANGNLKYTVPQKTLDVSHYSNLTGLTDIDPAFYGTGSGQHYHRMMKGINKSFFFVGNSKPRGNENVSGKGMTRYRTSIDSSRIYNMDKDPLSLWFAANPEKSEGMLKELGYDGFLARTDDNRTFVALFYPTDLETGELNRTVAPEKEPEIEIDEAALAKATAKYEREQARRLRRALSGKFSLTEEEANLNKISRDEDQVQPAVETGAAPEGGPAPVGTERGGVPTPAAGMESGAGAQAARRLGAQPNEEVRRAADGYNEEAGMGPITHGHYVPVDEPLARQVAAAFDALPELDDSAETVNSYAALAREVDKQWDYATKTLGITFEPWAKEGQPYANSREMVKDVKENKHLYFFQGGEPHPYMSRIDPETGLTSNDKFRAVHDLFGHAAEDYQFGPRGEENAWIKHSQMFSPEAQRALSTETRGQNSWVNYGTQNYDGDQYLNIPVAERPYAKQKVALLPVELTDWRAALARGGTRFSLTESRPDEMGFFSPLQRAIDTMPPGGFSDYVATPAVAGRSFPARTIRDKEGNVIKEIPARTEPDKPARIVTAEEQLRSHLEKYNVKKEEMDDIRDLSGQSFSDWIKDNSKATKDQIAQFVAENQVSVTPVLLEGEKQYEITQDGERTELIFDSPEAAREYIESQIQYYQSEFRIRNNSLYDPSGEEILKIEPSSQQGARTYKIINPNNPDSVISTSQFTLGEARDFLKYQISLLGDREYERYNVVGKPSATFEQYTLPGGENYQEDVLTLPKGARGAGYRSNHYPDIPNYLAHVRTKDRVTPDGQPVLFVEEIQSDLHQQAREKKYRGAESPEAKAERLRQIAEIRAQMEENAAEQDRIYAKRRKLEDDSLAQAFKNRDVVEQDRLMAEIKVLLQTAINLERIYANLQGQAEALSQVPNERGLPSAPFKKTWHEMAFKYLLHEAVRNGVDYLAWTTGEQQNNRYPGLETQVQAVEWNTPATYELPIALRDRRVKETDKLVSLITVRSEYPIDLKVEADGTVHPLGSSNPATARMEGASLSELIGADLASRILNEPSGRTETRDLVINSEGMTGFYDQILPQFAAKYLKKFGIKPQNINVVLKKQAEEPSPLDVPGEEGSTVTMPQTSAAVNAVRITPEMKQEFRTRGQPRYSLTSAKPRSVSTVGVTRETLNLPLEGAVPKSAVAKALNDMSRGLLGGEEFDDDQLAIAHGVMNAVAEGRHQLLLGDKSGADWYDTDIDTAKKYLRRALPGLKTDTDMVLFTAVMAPTSFGQNPLTNVATAVRIYEAAGEKPWGNLPPRQESGKGWTTRGKAVELGLSRLNQLVEERGERGTVNWLLKKHPISELRQYNENVSGRAGDLKYGAYIFGPKGGPFFLNMNGIREEMTKDLWWSRTFNRWFGTMEETVRAAPDEEGEGQTEQQEEAQEFRIQETPRNDADRRRMDAIANQAAQRLGLTIEELQATLWYYEQQLWKRLGAKVESYSFKDGALRILEKRGIERPRVRRSDSPNEQRRKAAYLLAASESRPQPVETQPVETRETR